MKKNLLFALGAASLVLMSSCQNDSIPASVDTVPVKISVALPDLQDATRAAGTAEKAFGDGKTATKLYYGVFEVYDKNGDGTPENVYLNDISGVKDINMTTDIVLQLMPKSSYKIAFWAASENAPYTCTFSGSEAYVKVDYTNILSNNENNDAFYGSTEINNVALDGGQTLIHNDGGKPVQLVRPFAQLNIATSNKDYEDAEKAGFKVTHTEVEVTGICDRLNLWTGEATTEGGRTYHKSDIPAGYTFPIVTGQKYLAMNYLLVPSDKQTAKVTFKYYNENREKTRDFDQVPVQRNWRTNIYGDLLTSTMKVNVEIAPLFADQNGTDDDATVNPDNNEWYDQNRQ